MKKFIFIFSFIFLILFSSPVYASDEGGSSNPFDFIISIFVPSEGYFDRKITSLNNRVNEKLGGVGYLFQTLNTFFKTLNSAPEYEFTYKTPDNFIAPNQPGANVDIFTFVKPFIKILRGAISCFIILLTCIACYKKLVVMFEK